MSLERLSQAGPNVFTAVPQRRNVPKEFAPNQKFDPTTGLLSEVGMNVKEAEAIGQSEEGYREVIKDKTGQEIPENREVILTEMRTWTMAGEDNTYLKFRIVPRNLASTPAEIDRLVEICRYNSGRKPPRMSERALTQTRLYGFSDEQLGKVDVRGGTEQFFARLALLLEELENEMRREPCEDGVLLLGGDIIEGFENTAQQSFTNDRSHPAQIDLANAYLTEIITRLASRHTRFRVVAVPSNHTAWRRGKDSLGGPDADYGLVIVKTVARALEMNKRWNHVEFYFPQPWDVSVAIPVRDDIVALTHGHVGKTFTPPGFKTWFLNQVAGDSPIAQATIVVSGHYHHMRKWPLGNLGNRERFHVQLPALDGGSSWFTNISGEWSHPGIWTAVVRDHYGLDYERHIRVMSDEFTDAAVKSASSESSAPEAVEAPLTARTVPTPSSKLAKTRANARAKATGKKATSGTVS